MPNLYKPPFLSFFKKPHELLVSSLGLSLCQSYNVFIVAQNNKHFNFEGKCIYYQVSLKNDVNFITVFYYLFSDYASFYLHTL